MRSQLLLPLYRIMVFFLYVEVLKMVEIYLELVKTLVIEYHLRDIFCLQMYALVTLAHMQYFFTKQSRAEQ